MTTDPVTAYARHAAKGRVPHPYAGHRYRRVCKLEQLAAERHLKDLRNGKQRGLRFDRAAAEASIGFFSHLRHYKGEFANKPLELSPWQQFIVGSLMGWKRDDGTRRFGEAYEEIPRKNGKSTKDAGLGVLLAFFDGEPGSEVYCAATKKDQARIVFGDAKQMVLNAPAIRKRIEVFTNNMNVPKTASKMEALGADEDTMDGLNPYAAIVDELHAHKTSGVVDVLRTAMGARRQRLIKHVTTAGFDRESICWKIREYARQILEGHIEDDAFFAYIAGVDEGDDWQSPATWLKANPNYGISVGAEYLRQMATQAKNLPAAENSFRRLHLNEWTEQSERAVSMDVWDLGGQPFEEEELRGRACFGGLKISAVSDLSAFVLVFPPEVDEGTRVLGWFWAPEDDVAARAKAGVPYDLWAKEGALETTPGNSTDAGRIAAKIVELAGLYEIRSVAINNNYAGEAASTLREQFGEEWLVSIGQTFLTMNAPTEEMFRLLKAGTLQHGGNRILRWNASNLAIKTNAAGNQMPDQERSAERTPGIVGIVALLNALDRSLRAAPPPDDSVYNERAAKGEEVLRFV